MDLLKSKGSTFDGNGPVANDAWIARELSEGSYPWQKESKRGHSFPIVLNPRETVHVTMKQWAQERRDILLQLALTHGAVLLRDFPVQSPEDFADISEALELEMMDMGCSAAPRKNVVRDVVFTSNEAPPSEPIPFHHEMAQCTVAPHYVLFYCDMPPASGGQTPILLTEEVVDYLTSRNPSLARDLERYGVRYRRVMPEETDSSSALGRSWKDTLHVSTREEAEIKLRESGSGFSQWNWLPGGALETITCVMPGIVKDPRTGHALFFNSIIAAYTGWVDSRNNPKESIMLGDAQGTRMDDATMNDVTAFMMRRHVCFPWQKGDVLLIDNHVTMHSRSPFERPRRILASLWGKRRNSHLCEDPFLCTADSPMFLSRSVEKTANQDDGVPSSDVPIGGPVLQLRSGDTMPAVGLGLWKVPQNETAEAVVTALRLGYRHLDCACDYGNETEVGDGIQEAIVLGIISSREEIWVTSKLWNTYHASEHVPVACKKTLCDLKLDYIDLYLVHFPIALKYVPIETRYPPGWVPKKGEPMTLNRVSMRETWEAMELLTQSGLARNIGICNIGASGLRDVLSYALVPPAVLQIERHIYLQQTRLVRMCQESGIVVTGVPPIYDLSCYKAASIDPTLTDSTVLQIARKYGLTSAQTLLRWGLDTKTSLITKYDSMICLQGLIAAGDGFTRGNEKYCGKIKSGFRLDVDDMAKLKSLDCGRRFNDATVFCETLGCFCPIFD